MTNQQSIHKLRGVNLGGWLVLEKWMTPSLFKDIKAGDEYTFCMEKGKNAPDALKKHRKTFITEADFKWLSINKINAIRIPVGYWIFGDKAPFIGCIEHLDWAMAMAEKYHLKVLIDLHAAPGSQNGFDHSGRIGATNWYKKPNRQETLEVLDRLAERYKKHDALWGIELLNEPAPWWYFRAFILRSWTKQVFHFLHSRMYRLVFSDAYVPWFMNGLMKHDKRSVMDVHHYQFILARDKKKSLSEHLELALSMKEKIAKWQQKQPVIIGEWSLALNGESLRGTKQRESEKSYGQAQLKAFETAFGWFFWSYKTEGDGAWNFRYCIENKLLEI